MQGHEDINEAVKSELATCDDLTNLIKETLNIRMILTKNYFTWMIQVMADTSSI